MKRIFSIIGFLLATALVGLAAPKDDSKAIEGTWVPTTAELGGQSLPEAVLKTISLQLSGGKYEALVAGEPDKGNYALDPAGNPTGITVTGTEGPNRGKTFPAIYELNADTLRICYDLSGAKRPTEFKSSAGTSIYLVTYRRKQG